MHKGEKEKMDKRGFFLGGKRDSRGNIPIWALWSFLQRFWVRIRDAKLLIKEDELFSGSGKGREKKN